MLGGMVVFSIFLKGNEKRHMQLNSAKNVRSIYVIHFKLRSPSYATRLKLRYLRYEFMHNENRRVSDAYFRTQPYVATPYFLFCLLQHLSQYK